MKYKFAELERSRIVLSRNKKTHKLKLILHKCHRKPYSLTIWMDVVPKKTFLKFLRRHRYEI